MYQPEDTGRTAHELWALAEQVDVAVETRVVKGGKPENVIVNQARRGNFDLLIMGVLFGPTEELLYFGPKVETILREARCAVAMAAFSEVSARVKCAEIQPKWSGSGDG